jgi:hypothetical protein
MRAVIIATTAAIGLAGCQQQGSAPANSAAEEQAAPVASNGNESAAVASGTPSAAANAVANVTGALPPPTGLRFVGLWASDVKNCSTAAWRFTDTSLSTPAGSHCTFSKVTAVPGGYDIAASCTAEGPANAETIKLRFAESAQARLFESDAIPDTGLVYCGREG